MIEKVPMFIPLYNDGRWSIWKIDYATLMICNWTLIKIFNVNEQILILIPTSLSSGIYSELKLIYIPAALINNNQSRFYYYT